MRTRTFELLGLGVLATALLGACGGGSSDGSSTISGTIEFVAENAPLMESEPNDSVDDPQRIGELTAGLTISIHGELGANERYDAFSFVAPERVRVSASLRYTAGASGAPTDVQLGVYDPISMRAVSVARGASDARFHAKGACDVVVRRGEHAGPYTLTLRATAADAAIALPGHLGAFVTDDRAIVRGGTGARWTLTAAEAQSLDLSFANARVRVTDADGVELLNTTEPSTLALAPLACIALEVIATEPIELSIESHPAHASLAPQPIARVGTLAAERTAWNAAIEEPLYGRTTYSAMSGQVLVLPRTGADLSEPFARRRLTQRDRIPGDAIRIEASFDAGLDEVERARTTLALARSFDGDPRVEYAELNLRRQICGGTVTPNDTFYPLQWHYPLLRLPEAWAISTGSSDVIAAIIDTGMTAHPDLVNRQIAGYDFISDPDVAADNDGLDADPTDVGDGVDPQPSSFHGTHVAGTIGAETNNVMGPSSPGVAGVTWATRLMHLRVLGQGGGSDFDIANAVRYAARLSNNSGLLPAERADVINMSLGGPGSNSTMQSAVTAAKNAGVVIFAAAGNNNSGTPFYPAAYNNVISISAVDINSAKAPYSNFHASVDLCAPGGDTSVDHDGDSYVDGVLSTLMDESTFPLTPIYAFYQGTSMACPHAAGVAALMLAVNPALMPAQIEALLKETATDLGASGQDIYFGAGLIDAFAALQAAGGTTPGTPVLSVSPSTLSFGTSADELTATVTNTGGGALNVTSASESTAWLSVVLVPSSSSSTNVSGVQVTLDRTQLPAGDQIASILVNSNGGTATLTVNANGDAPPAAVNVDLYVLLVDLSDPEFPVTVAGVRVNPTTGLAYSLGTDPKADPIPPGDYLLVCGSDDNDDDIICGDGDIYCGAFPTLNEPELIPFDGTQYEAVDFVVAPGLITPGAAGARHHGFRLLR